MTNALSNSTLIKRRRCALPPPLSAVWVSFSHSHSMQPSLVLLPSRITSAAVAEFGSIIYVALSSPSSVRLNEFAQLCGDKAAGKAKPAVPLSEGSMWGQTCPRPARGRHDAPCPWCHTPWLSSPWTFCVLLSLRGSNFLSSPAPPDNLIFSFLPPENVAWDLVENISNMIFLEMKGITIAIVNKSNHKDFPMYFSSDPPSRSEVKYTVVILNTSMADVSPIICCDQWWKCCKGAFAIL